MKAGRSGVSFWCVYVYNVVVLMSTLKIYKMNSDEARLLKVCVGVVVLIHLLFAVSRSGSLPPVTLGSVQGFCVGVFSVVVCRVCPV